MLTLLAFGVVIGVLIFVHELGHFIAAKAVGIGVPRFSIGFGPPTPLRFTRGGTEYVLSWLPLGGYVKMASREEQEAMGALEGGAVGPEYPTERLFENKPLAARILVLSAGVAMNALFAWLIYTGLAVTLGQEEAPITTIGFVDRDALPLEARTLADVPDGTRIVAVNGDTVATWNAVTRGVLDPSSDRLRFDFAGGVDPAVLPVPGTAAVARAQILDALKPAWPPKIGAIQAQSPAHTAGVEPGDKVVRVAGDTVRYWDDIARLVRGRAGDTLAVTLLRDDSLITVAIVPTEQTEPDPVTGQPRKAAKLGVFADIATVHVEYGVMGALAEGTRRSVDAVGMVLFTLKGMVAGQISLREIGGPILIGQVSGQAAQAGLGPFLAIMAFVSINLAILNLLPIPVLDGGHLVFLVVEGLRGGRPLPLQLRIRLTQAGLIALMGLMVLVIANDVLRIFRG